MTRQWPNSPFTDEQIKERISQAQAEGMKAWMDRGGFSDTNVFYLSFADPHKPKGTQWLGGCYIKADSMNEATVLSHALKINPGGEIRLAGPFPQAALRSGYEHRLLDQQGVSDAIDESKL